jgi:outer membrane protein assembly factor BamB
MARAPAFQAGDAGSIPVTRSGSTTTPNSGATAPSRVPVHLVATVSVMQRSFVRIRALLTVSGLVVLAVAVVAAAALAGRPRNDAAPVAADDPVVEEPGPEEPGPEEPGATAPPTTAPPTEPVPTEDPPPTGLHGGPHGSVSGLLMFRGNPTRNWYGRGPVPAAPEVAWRYPEDRKLCSTSVVGGEERQWCGTGWTGQPAVWVRPDGVTELVVGTYDRAVHFLDVATGQPTRPPFPTGDLIKGSVTLDPDGYPLLYFGSRDNKYRIVALDRDRPTELWALLPHPRGVWNNDWDGNGVIVDDVLYEGGEDSWFRAVLLNRGYGADGLVTVDPVVLAEAPGFDDELLAAVGDRNVSIESSPLVLGDVVYVVNSGGLVSGFDVSRIRTGEMPRVFRFWLGDDADATLVADADGAIYAAIEYERKLPRSREVGQLVKLDPTRPDDPFVWGVSVPPRPVGGDGNGGIWATPAVYGDFLYVTTHPGDLLVVDRMSGAVVHEERVGYHEWSSPVVVDDTLVVGLCEAGRLRAYSLADPAAPRALWDAPVPTGSCIESTPAVWDGGIYVGSRDGWVYGFR